jgi:hypothetical protein
MRNRRIALGVVAAAASGLCCAASGPPGAHPFPAGYHIKLERFIVPPNRIAGVLVKARINGGPTLRLLVDSGSESVVLNRRAALSSGCAGGTDVELVGAGGSSAGHARHSQADTLEIGDLTLHDTPLLIQDHALPGGIQGVLPLSIFAGFLIRLDFPAKELDLLPYPMGQPDNAGTLPVVSNNQLLFLKATVNETHEGFFLVDTGSAYTAVSWNLARQLHAMNAIATRVALEGGVAEMEAPSLTGSVRLRLASQDVATGPVVAVDLSTASQYHGIEVSGLLGYSALCESILTMNYRDGLVRIEPK